MVKTMRMDWKKLLSVKRLGKDISLEDPHHPTFQRDFDRIIFSSAFRRLQDKTQVFPLAESDYVRTRLTHSLEVSCVGRSLGTIIGSKIIDKHKLENVHPSDIGSIVSAACLAHDIGNPPLGHSGEDAIKYWFADSSFGKRLISDLDYRQQADFLNYEGNAQGFRVLARLQTPDNKGGMQLTCSTLAAYTKYPRASCIRNAKEVWTGESFKKWGFFQQDSDLFTEMADSVGLLKRDENQDCWCRHPLAFIVEAADDITYRIIDFEDGYRTGNIAFQDLKKLLIKIIGDSNVTTQLKKIYGEKEKAEYLRAKAINCLIHEIVSVFIREEDSILSGQYDKDIISDIPNFNNLKLIKELAKGKAYSSRTVIEIEAAGFHVLSRLLQIFLTATENVASNGETKASYKSTKILQLVPKQFLAKNGLPDKNKYMRVINITDFVSGMTDTYAVSLYKKLTGISIA